MNIEKKIQTYQGILRIRCAALMTSNFLINNEKEKSASQDLLQKVNDTAKEAHQFIVDDLHELTQRAKNYYANSSICKELLTAAENLQTTKLFKKELIDFIDRLASIHGERIIFKEVFFSVKNTLEDLENDAELTEEYRQKAYFLVCWIRELRRL